MLTIYPKVYFANTSKGNESSTAISQMPPQFPTQQSDKFQGAKSIAFGDADCPDSYQYDNVFRERINAGIKIHGETPEEAFSNFYDQVQEKLLKQKILEDKKGTKRAYYVSTSMLGDSKADFTNVLSKFTREYGNKPKFSNFEVGVSNYLTNVCGFEKPKWWQVLKTNEYTHQDYIIRSMENFFKKGLIDIKHLK